VWSVAR